MDAQSAKLLMRRASAMMSLGWLGEALNDFDAVLSLQSEGTKEHAAAVESLH